MRTVLHASCQTTHEVVSEMLTRRRPGSKMGNPLGFDARSKLPVGQSKYRRVLPGSLLQVFFLCLCAMVSFSSLTTVLTAFGRNTRNTSPWLESSAKNFRVVFLDHDPSMQNSMPRPRTVERLGNYTAQRRIRRADDLHLTNVEEGDCRLRHEWQKTLYPNCNLLHELRSQDQKIVGHGYWRDVWVVDHANEKVVFKSMRYEHDNTHRNLDRMRRDANVMERMSSSPFIIDLYGFCGSSSFSEFGPGGDIEDALSTPPGEEQQISQLGKLRIGKEKLCLQGHMALDTQKLFAHLCSSYTSCNLPS